MFQSESTFRIARMDNVKRFNVRDSIKDILLLDEEKLIIKDFVLPYVDIRAVEIGRGADYGVPGFPIINIYCFDGRWFMLFKSTAVKIGKAKTITEDIKQLLEHKISVVRQTNKGGVGGVEPKQQESIPSQNDLALEKVSKLLNISSKVKIDDIAEMLGVKRGILMDKIVEWSTRIPIQIDGDYLIVKKEDVVALINGFGKENINFNPPPRSKSR